MNDTLLAAAGLQDCADAGMNCMPGVGGFLALLFGGIFVALVWIPICIAATVSIVAASNTVGRLRAALFTLGVWCLPLVGIGVWVAYQQRNLRGVEESRA